MKKKIIMAIMILLIIIGAVLGILYLKEQADFKKNASGLSGYILGEGMEPNLTDEEIQALLQKEVDESKVVFSIYSEPVFNGNVANIMFANPQHSAHDIALTVTVGGKTIIKTGKISPNQYIENVELLGKALKKGQHKGAALITAYKRDTGEEVGKVSVELDITSE